MTAKLIAEQVIALHQLMSQHCKRGANGLAEYEQGWDDDRVLEEITKHNPTSRPYNKGHIVGLRQKMFGRLYAVPNTDALNELKVQVAELSAKVQSIETMLKARFYIPPPGRPISTPKD